MARNEPLSKGEKRLLIASLVFVLLAGVVGYRFYSINVNPVVSIPEPPPMPSPNAMDVYLAAQKLIVHDIPAPAGFSSSIHPGNKLTIDDIRACTHAGKIAPNPRGRVPKPPKLADMQALMAKNAPVMAKARQGFSCEYHEIPSRAIETLYPHLSKLRDLMRTMMADGVVRCASGDWDGGAERFLDVMRIGNDCPRGGILISMQTGDSLQAVGRREAWSTLDHISSAEARRAARRLEEMAARRVQLADILREDKYIMQASLLKLFNVPGWRKPSSSDFTMMSFIRGHDIPDWKTELRIQTASKRSIMRHFTRHMDALIANTKKLYPASAKPPPLPNDPICEIILPVFDRAWKQYAAAQTENDLLMVSFALRAYKADQGAYPTNVKALTPVYLQTIPTDVFSAGPLKYKVTGKSCILYSVGPDGKDNGGTPGADGTPAAPVTGFTILLPDNPGFIGRMRL